MENEYDVYGDLEEFRLKNVLNEKNDLLMKLEEQYSNSTNEIASLESECKTLRQKCKNIEKSFWSLLEVCKAELKRKDALLDTLKSQRDDIAFRRINNKKEFLTKYPSGNRGSSTEVEKKICYNLVNEINDEPLYSKNHTIVKNPFKKFDTNQFPERKKHSPIRYRDQNSFRSSDYKNSSPENSSTSTYMRSLKQNKNIELPISDTIKHRSEDSIYKSSYQTKNLSLSKNSREQNKNYCDKMLEKKIKNTDLSKSKPDKEKRNISLNDTNNDEINISNEGEHENSITKSKNTKLSKEHYKIKSKSRLVENEKNIDVLSSNGNDVNSDSIKKPIIKNQVPNSLSVLQNKCSESIKKGEKIKSDLEPLGKNKKIDVEHVRTISLENSSIPNKFPQTFEEILFDEIVSGKDSLQLKSSPTKTTTTLKNCSDKSLLYDSIEELSVNFNTSENLSTEAKSKELNKSIHSNSIAEICNLSEQQSQCQSKEVDNQPSENGDNQNLNETLEEGELVIDDESDEPFVEGVGRELKITNETLKSNVENVLSKDIQKVGDECQNIVEDRKNKSVSLKKNEVNIVSDLLVVDISNEIQNNAGKKLKKRSMCDSSKTQLTTIDGKEFNNNPKSTSNKKMNSKQIIPEHCKETISEKPKKDNVLNIDIINDNDAQVKKNSAPQQVNKIKENKFRETNSFKEEKPKLKRNSLINHKKPKIKKSTNTKSHKKNTSLPNVAKIESNIVKEPSFTEILSIDKNLEKEQVKLHLAKTQNSEIITSAVASITNEINYEQILYQNNIRPSSNSSASFKSVQTTPESSPEPASRSFTTETLEATAFLTTNLLVSKKLNLSTTSDDNKIVHELNTDNICINEDNKQDTERYSIRTDKDCSAKPDLKIIDLEKEVGNNFSSELFIKNKSTKENKKSSKRKMKDKMLGCPKKKLKSETTNKLEQKQIIDTEDIKQSELYLKNENIQPCLSENVTKMNNCTPIKQSESKFNENNLKISLELNDESTIFETAAKKTIKNKVLKEDAQKHLLSTNRGNNDGLVANGKGNVTSNKNTENLQSIQNSEDILAIIQTPIKCNMIRKSTRIANRTEKGIEKLKSKNDEKLQNEENNYMQSGTENKLSEKDEELFNCFFKSPFHSASVESINISGKSELCHQLEKDFEEMFSTPPQNSISDTSMESKIFDNTVANENGNSGKCLDKLDLINNKQKTNLNNSLNLDNSLNEPQPLSSSTILNTTASPLIKKFSTSLKEYELIVNENESVTWVITKRKTKKKKKVIQV